MSLTEYYDFRDRLIDFVRRDIVGYDSPDEILEDPPITRYAAGILFPRKSGVVVGTQDDELEQGVDNETSPDPAVAMANVRYPSSMGLTMSVDLNATSAIRVTVEAGRYEKLDTTEKGAAKKWQRVPVGPEEVQIDVTTAVKGKRKAVTEGLELFFRVRPQAPNQSTNVTLVLLNTHPAPETGGRDEVSFFQPVLTVDAPHATAPAFVGRDNRRVSSADSDIRSYRLLYRRAVPIAVGHGCSVEWEHDETAPTRARRVNTMFVPKHELLLSDSPELDSPAQVMRDLAEGTRQEVIQALKAFCDRYGEWIAGPNGLTTKCDALDESLQSTATGHIQGCRDALERMRAGVTILSDDDDVWTAFQLANKAMLRLRARSEWLNEECPMPEPSCDQTHRWYPFQIAFILLALKGIADGRDPERALVDLLWFPTGGGKTEAYLGLVALVIFLRRLRHNDQGDGVTVIMRYTLRLLTIQQFERAAALVCCCESIRRESHALGRAPISIGLWVGQDGTPNTIDAARSALNKLRRGEILEKGNPIQLRRCPWCGAALTHRNYYITNVNRRLVITCRQDRCLFKKELPVVVVDDDIYRTRPSLLIATADKFASMPWQEKAVVLFNRRNQGCPPPELIIQDELHLISGPLGTLAGLYETAVDFLCTDHGVRPKVIASTATIRRAEDQARALFNRAVRQFPPPGLDASNSFFAVESTREDKGSRMYLGLMAPATSQTMLLVRTYAALLQGVKELDGPAAVKDHYWSLVGYFNSLRVLGGARMQVQDDVAEDRIPLLAAKSGQEPRTIENRIELTSREPSGDIPGHLERMQKSAYPAADALDVILATNMISVGMDVDRLGLMAVMGQPQSTSEYIQATSRVGRKYPGLVCVMFNAAKSRDRSHYESFVNFHSALYRQVESTSVTPFSSRARDRALHAVVVALARFTIRELAGNNDAHRIEEVVDRLASVKSVIVDRVRQVEEKETTATEKQIDEIITQWRNLREHIGDGLSFFDYSNPERAVLVDAADADPALDNAFPTMRSLRDVDPESKLYPIR